ncbi:DciA family protein [Candidatus Foliamicus sp.]
MARTRRKGRPERVAAALSDWTTQAGNQMALAERLREALHPELREGFAGSDLDAGGTLTVYAAAPEWAARLRFEATGLEQAAGKGGWAVRKVRIKLAL